MNEIFEFIQQWSNQTLNTKNIFSFKNRIQAFFKKKPNVSKIQIDSRLDLKDCPKININSISLNTKSSLLPLSSLLLKRRSIREFQNIALNSDQLFQLLKTSFQYTKSTELDLYHRPYPSPGSLNSNRTSLLILNVQGLKPGFYYYSAFEQNLYLISPLLDKNNILFKLGISCQSAPAAMIILTARYDYTLEKYGPRALRFIYQESGAILQTLSLVCTDLQIASYPYGGGLDLEILTALGLHQSQCVFTGLLFLGVHNNIDRAI